MKHFKDLRMIIKKVRRIEATVNKNGIKHNERVIAEVWFEWFSNGLELGFDPTKSIVVTSVTERKDGDKNNWKLAEKIAISKACRKALKMVKNEMIKILEPSKRYMDNLMNAIKLEENYIKGIQ